MQQLNDNYRFATTFGCETNTHLNTEKRIDNLNIFFRYLKHFTYDLSYWHTNLI